MKIIFLGSTKFSEELLNSLINNNFDITAVFTIPKVFTVLKGEKVVNHNYSDLSKITNKNNIPIYYVDEDKKLSSYEKIIKSINPDIILVLGWYYIVPKVIREIPKYGACGIHASMLPKYAGWAPLVWSIIHGEKETGVTFFQFNDSVDGGDIIAQKNFKIDINDTIKEAYSKATIESSNILVRILPIIDTIKFKKQDKNKLKIYNKRTPKDGEIDFSKSAKEIYDFIRAQTRPYPCAFSTINNERIKIIDSKLTNIKNNKFKYGEVVLLDNTTLVATKDYLLDLGVIDDGKREYKFKDYARIKSLWEGVFQNKEY